LLSGVSRPIILSKISLVALLTKLASNNAPYFSRIFPVTQKPNVWNMTALRELSFTFHKDGKAFGAEKC
jgi:hypothetical protein